MMVVSMGPEQARQYLEEMRVDFPELKIFIACLNSPSNVTISGLVKHLDALKKMLDAHSIFNQKLKVSLAYHSQYMATIAEDYRIAIGSMERTSTISEPRFYSTSVMKEISLEDLRLADYWVNNLISPVQFASALAKLCESKYKTGTSSSTSINVLVEIGPHSALRTPIKQIISTSFDTANISYYAAQMRNMGSNNAFLRLVGSLHCLGYPMTFGTSSMFGMNPVCLADLPEYVFDHSKSYWHESRLSKNFRFRKYPTSDLLGARVHDWNPLDARWRNIISTLENPWVEDHGINGTLLYPGAGQLVMAIEAAAQHAEDFDERKPSGFRLKDVTFVKSLNISLKPEGVETQISLKPLRDAADRSVGWSTFKIFLYENDLWAETCGGQITVEYKEPENEIDGGREKRERADMLRKRYQDFSSRCTTRVSTEKVYRRLKDYGLELGPTFKVFDKIRCNNERQTTLQIKLRQWTVRGNPLYSQSHYIHPTALDGILQLGVVTLSNCGNDDVPTMVPSRIRKLWLSAEGLSGESTAPLKCCAEAEYRGYRETNMDILAMDQTAELPRIVVEGLETIIIGSRRTKQAFQRHLCYKLRWETLMSDTVRQDDASNHTGPILVQSMRDFIIVAGQTTLQQDLARKIQQTLLPSQALSCNILSLEEAARISSPSACIYIFMVDFEQFCLSRLNEESFLALKHIVAHTKVVIWAYSNPQNSSKNISGSIQGLARTLRTEYEGLKFVSAGLEMNVPVTEIAATIIEILQRSLSTADEDYEPEYLQIDGNLAVSRLTEDYGLNEILTKQTRGHQQELRAFGSHAALKLGIGTPGLLDTLQFEEDHSVATPLLPHEIEVKPEYCGLNFMDCLVALGRVPQASLGIECAGTVVQAGKDSDLFPGDSVMLCGSGAIKSIVRCHYNTAVKIPESIPLHEAAALPGTAATIYHALYNVARLQRGEKILIHSAAGATGQSAIQMATTLGATIFVTVGSAEKKQLVMDRYKISEDHIFYSRNADFAEGIRRVTEGRGVDVILNSLAGDSLVASWECIAAFGRFIEIGKRDIYAHKQLPMFPFAKNVTFSTVDLAGLWQARPLLMRQLLKAVVDMATRNEISVASPLHIYPLSKIEEAFRLLQSGKQAGKIVIDMDKDSQVTTSLAIQPEYEFSRDASYVISGGFGGLGKSAARWLVARGAKHLLLLSRSGPQTDADSVFIKELESRGVNVKAPCCDITKFLELSKVLEEYSAEMPPIRGCIQGAMVLRVSPNMQIRDVQLTNYLVGSILLRYELFRVGAESSS